MVSRLATSAWAAGLALRGTDFGSVLRQARSGDVLGREVTLHEDFRMPDRLHGWELSYDPALHRTQAALFALMLMGEPAPAGIGDWVSWVTRASQAVQRISSKCWAGVSQEVRRTFVDSDDAWPAAGSGAFYMIRQDEQGRPSLRFAGLDTPQIRDALREMSTNAKASDAHAEARRASAVIERSTSLQRRLTTVRANLGRRMEAPPDTLIADAFKHAVQACEDAYEGDNELRSLVEPLRRYNRLVTNLACVLLGLAEARDPTVVTDTVGPVVDHLEGTRRWIHLTVRRNDLFDLRPTHPVMVELGSPLDGLYRVEGYTMAMSGLEEVDLHLSAFDLVGGGGFG